MFTVKQLFAIVPLALVLTACERNSTAPGDGTRLSAGTPLLDENGPDEMPAVTGHYEFVGVNTGNDFKYSLSAVRHMDGSVSGEVEERATFNATGDLVRDMHGTVTCFTIVNDTAYIAGIVDRVLSLVPAQKNLGPGDGFRLVVVDNGNGAGDPPDEGSNARFGLPASSAAFCARPVPFNLEPIEHGNVEIRDGTI
jgi:hypothetical protein